MLAAACRIEKRHCSVSSSVAPKSMAAKPM
jgi:hypothetical protein